MANNTVKYLDLDGLKRYDGKIKAWVNDKIQDLGSIKSNAEKGLTAYNAWASFLAGTPSNTVTPTLKELATTSALNQAIIDLKNEASTGYDTLKGLETEIKKVAASVANKNVTAEGESGDNALVSASAANNKVTVSTTEKLKDAVALAESALQAANIVEGSTDGTISVKGSAVKVHGLGTAAFTNSNAYDVAGAASTAEQNAKKYAADEIKKLNAETLKMSGAADAPFISSEITNLKNSISGGTFFRGVVDSLDNIQDAKNGDVVAVSSTGLEYIYDGTRREWIELGDSSKNAQAITNLTNNKLGKTETAVDSAKLGGQLPGYYATKQSVTDLSSAAIKSIEGGSSTYVTVTAGEKDASGKVKLTIKDTISTALGTKLGKTETAADSAKLDGQLPSYYATAQSVTDLANSLVSITNDEIDALFTVAQA